MAIEQARYVVRFCGDVQGVGFRATAQHHARGLEVHGFVRNQPDGSVLLDVEGNESALKELLARVEQSMSGRIEEVTIDRPPPLGRSGGFQITP